MKSATIDNSTLGKIGFKYYSGGLTLDTLETEKGLEISLQRPHGDGKWHNTKRYYGKFTPLGNGWFWASSYWLGFPGIPIETPFRVTSCDDMGIQQQ